MCEMHVRWAIIFEAGLDEEEAKKYLSSEQTQVVDIIRDSLTICNTAGEEEERECVIFLLSTEGLFVPRKFMLELNLQRVPDQPFVYYPVVG